MKNPGLRRMILTALFAAIIIVMAFTPLGYLRIGAIAITLIPIPVAISAIVLGPAAGAAAGTVFGITSLVQCFGVDAFGTLLMGINPVFTVILCLVPRFLCGWLSGIIFKALKKIDKTGWLSYFAGGFCTAALNTLLFLAGLYFMFAGNPEFVAAYGTYNLITIFVAMAGINGLVEILSCTVVAPAVSKALVRFTKTSKI